MSVTDANGNTTNTAYDKLGRTIKVTSPALYGLKAETKTYYDKNSNVVKNAVKKSAQEYSIEEYKYDNMGNLLGVIAHDGGKDAVTQYSYDTANRMMKMITGLTAYSANPTGGNVTTYEYDEFSNLIQLTDPIWYSLCYRIFVF